MVHRSVVERMDPYELMFNRKMMTKLPNFPIKPNRSLDVKVWKKHDEEKLSLQTRKGRPRSRRSIWGMMRWSTR